EPGQRRGRGTVYAGDAQNLLDDVGLHQHIWSPRRHTDPSVRDAEAQMGQDGLAFFARDIGADKSLDLAVREINPTPRRRWVPRHDHARRLAAADLDHEFRRQLTAGNAEIRIDAALE